MTELIAEIELLRSCVDRLEGTEQRLRGDLNVAEARNRRLRRGTLVH